MYNGTFILSDMCEKLFSQLEKTTERFEVKLMMMDLASRLIGIHQVCSKIALDLYMCVEIETFLS